MLLEKHWLGPTRCIWTVDSGNETQCQGLDRVTKKNLDDCKLACENNESCNAIIYEESLSQCDLGNCSSPVPAPTDPANGKQGYYRGTGKKQIAI